MQLSLIENDILSYGRLHNQLLKWIGNKQRFAVEIISYFPKHFNKYYEPFLGSGAILATLAPKKALGSDIFTPLIEIWQTLKNDPDKLKGWYSVRWEKMINGNKITEYEKIKESYNKKPNGADLLFLSRSCYGGVVRFRKLDGYMSTPCGIHDPIKPKEFSKRVDDWHNRTINTNFETLDYKEAMSLTKKDDLIYCDPPYLHSQGILYGAQEFKIEELMIEIEKCKSRGVHIALSMDGIKKSGNYLCDLPIPKNLFKNEVFVNVGRSMLKRFKMEGKTLEKEVVSDRLLLTY